MLSYMTQIFAVLLALSSIHAADSDPKATAHIKKSEEHTRGKSLESNVTMIVDRNGKTRTLKFKMWTQGRDKAVVKIYEPVKERDTGNLRLDLNLWQYLPNIDRLVKVPPSMMLQSWMGSQFTNDDLVRTSSLTTDYTHKIEKNEKVGEYETVKIICTPKPTAPVVWGKVIEWVRVTDSVPVKREMYSETGTLVKRMEGAHIKTFGSHTVPTQMTMIDVKNPSNKTVMKYDEVKFDQPIDAGIFTQSFLSKPLQM
ncbi:MAG: outer membrane lipoprotein-sorting protein [Bdellovibrionales bacterium]|nr:outer membrane lipoprotein-sorting protein [Bdellovibrionales bacterium]